MAAIGDRIGEDLEARPAGDRSGGGVPRPRRRRGHGDAVRGRSRDGAEEGERPVPADPGAQREGVSEIAASEPAGIGRPAATGAERAWRPPSYWPFVVPAVIVVLAVIVFPWVFTLWMSVHEWKIGAPTTYVGVANYLRLPNDPRFVEAVWHTLVYTVLSVLLPLVLGTFAAIVFHARFPMRGFLRGLFILPMMATPVAIALVWTMMFHPQLGVLNYLLSLVGIPPQLWVFHPATVIPSLVLVETWQWTPLVMLIVLGVGDAQPLSLQRRLHLLRRRLRLGDRRRVLRPHRRARGDAALFASAHAMERDPGQRMSPRQILGKLGLAFAVVVIVSPAILFFIWMLSLSVKYEIDNAAYPPILIPERFAWKNYADVLASNRFPTYFVNSLIVTGAATLFALLVGVPAGYGIARMRAHKSAVVILIARITPGLSYLIPLFLLFQWLGLLGTLWPQIIIHLVVTVPIMIGYFETTPMELEEAALIDGATRWQVFRHVALPIARPGIAVAFILAVIFSWNNFVFGIVLAGRETRTLPVAVYNMISFDQLSWGPLAAAALIVTFPVLLLTVFAQRQIVAGLTAGAVKGG